MSKNKSRSRIVIFGTLKIMVASALFVAMSIVLGKYLAVNIGAGLRLSFENLPIIFAGVIFGPIVGVAVAVASDIIGCVLVGYAINPIVTLGAAFIGLISGLPCLALKRTKLPYAVKVLLSVFPAHIVGSILIKSFGLAAYAGMPFGIFVLLRLGIYLAVGGLEFALVYFISKNKLIRSQLDSFKRG